MSVSDVARPILDGVYKLRNDNGHDASYAFQILPDKKLYDYYRVIKKPMALNMIRLKLKNKEYTSISQFIVDLVQITHNARTYNPPESFIYTDAVLIDHYLRDQLSKLRQKGLFEPSELEYPDLGPLPQHLNGNGTVEDDSMDSMDDSDASDGMEDGDIGGRRRRPVRRSVILGRRKRQEEEEEEEKMTVADRAKKRGRPPTVDKPHEHRIKAVMRAVRRERDPVNGQVLYTEFEKLPDQKQLPDYYEQISEPIALDAIRKNIKRRKYGSIEAFLKDMNTLFNNAQQYNPVGSQIHEDAVHLQKVLTATAEEEMKKPDTAYQDPDSNSKTSRLPLDQVEHRGEIYRVGDWVHISNPNDPAKPTIGQIFRIWQADGEKWINACWYYRPEQTVHRYDKLFYENEVVKSGQYRDHTVDEVLEKCFVMFITKYQRGRPVGVGNASVYCCESRYNEQEKTFNKIRTWKACIPDEIRSTDYPMDLFDRPRQLKRLISPIKHLLPADAKETDPIPEPKMGSTNAPPIVGAVYKRPFDPDDPPEQPTPLSPAGETRRASSVTPSPGPQQATPIPNQGSGQLKPGARTAFDLNIGASGFSRSGTIFNGPPGAQGGPTAMPTAYAMPGPVVAQLEPDEMAQVAKLRDGQLLWFPSCPVWVSHRVLADPVPKATVVFSHNGPDQGLVSPKGIGHSAKYMAWKLARQQRH